MIDTPADELALELAVAHQRRDPFTPIPARWRDLNFAYSVQDRLVSRWREAGEGDIVGWKVGLTSARMQAFAGINQPIAGAILSRHQRQSGTTLDSSQYVHLGIEAELAVRIGTAFLELEEQHPGEVLRRLDSISAAFEIVEDRNADYRSLDAASLIADNSWNMGVVLGVPTSAQRIHALTGRRGVLSVNGEPTDQGMSEDCGGDPLRIVAWLAAHLARRGQPLQPHQWVLTGSIVTTKFPMPGDRFHFALEGLSPVEVQIA
jgi:2-keto-4-pentenoate hydratase